MDCLANSSSRKAEAVNLGLVKLAAAFDRLLFVLVAGSISFVDGTNLRLVAKRARWPIKNTPFGAAELIKPRPMPRFVKSLIRNGI